MYFYVLDNAGEVMKFYSKEPLSHKQLSLKKSIYTKGELPNDTSTEDETKMSYTFNDPKTNCSQILKWQFRRCHKTEELVLLAQGPPDQDKLQNC